jgi:hypothetical protein
MCCTACWLAKPRGVGICVCAQYGAACPDTTRCILQNADKQRDAKLGCVIPPNPRQLMPHQQLLLQQNVGRQLHISKTPDMPIRFLTPVRRPRGACSNIQHQQQHQALHTDPGWIARQCSQIDHTHAHSTEYYTSYTTTTTIHIDTPCSLQ